MAGVPAVMLTDVSYSLEELALPTRHVFKNEDCSNGMQPLQLLLQPYSRLAGAQPRTTW